MNKVRETVVSIAAPVDKNVIWIDISGEKAIQKIFRNGQWEDITGGASGDVMTKVENPHNGNILLTDETGQAVDAGYDASSFLATPSTTGQEGEVLSVDNDGNPVWTTITPTGTADTEMSDTSTNAVQNKAIKEYVDSNFARQDGWYDTLVSGAAKNLVGHGTTPAEYTFRTSGGNADIGTGTATIDVLKGKTLKWQQLQKNGDFSENTGWNPVRCTLSISDGIATLTGADSATNIYIAGAYGYKISYKANHKYYASALFKPSSAVSQVGFSGVLDGAADAVANTWQKFSVIKTITQDYSNNDLDPTFRGSDLTNEVCYVKSVQIFDLTEMGLDSITTVAEFEALYPLDYYAYTATPVLINNAASGIETTGFNQWDEEWENGTYDADGVKISSSIEIRSKNLIPIFPSTTYYVKNGSQLSLSGTVACFYDANKNFIKEGGTNPVYPGKYSCGNAEVTTPTNARYMAFYTIGTTYNNDICINLSWSGYRNGEYEPYEQHTLYFNGESGSLATVTGKKIVDGEPTGESVTIFPDGWKSAGSVYDFGKADSDGYIRKVTKVLKKLVLNADNINQILSYSQYNGYYYVSYKNTFTPDAKPNSFNIVSTNGKGSNSTTPDSMYIVVGNTNLVWFPLDQTITTKEAYETYISNNPVTLYYELNTPEEYLLDTPIPANYLVNDFGTEQRIPVDTASSVMAPVSLEVAYAMNSVDILRRLGINYIKKESMDHILTAFKTAGIIADYTLTYDATDDDYTCSIEAPTPGE